MRPNAANTTQETAVTITLRWSTCPDLNFAIWRGSKRRSITTVAHNTIPGSIPVPPGGTRPNRSATSICNYASSCAKSQTPFRPTRLCSIRTRVCSELCKTKNHGRRRRLAFSFDALLCCMSNQIRGCTNGTKRSAKPISGSTPSILRPSSRSFGRTPLFRTACGSQFEKKN